MFNLWLLIGWRSRRLRVAQNARIFLCDPPGESVVWSALHRECAVRKQHGVPWRLLQLLLGVGVITITYTAVLPHQGLLIGARDGTEMITVDEENLSW
jgi:hypothetical protein